MNFVSSDAWILFWARWSSSRLIIFAFDFGVEFGFCIWLYSSSPGLANSAAKALFGVTSFLHLRVQLILFLQLQEGMLVGVIRFGGWESVSTWCRSVVTIWSLGLELDFLLLDLELVLGVGLFFGFLAVVC